MLIPTPVDLQGRGGAAGPRMRSAALNLGHLAEVFPTAPVAIGPPRPHLVGLTQSPAQAAAPRAAHDDLRAFETELVALIPHMRAFARSLCRDPTAADDVAQEALAKAWKNRESYRPGTNMKAWTFMILRNQFLSEKRRDWRAQPLDQEQAERTLLAVDNPDAGLALGEVRQALEWLPFEQREALIMVGAGGLSYDEAAEATGVPVGTVKSRVSRGRAALQAILDAGAFKGAPPTRDSDQAAA